MQGYKDYKETGLDWLPLVPKHWEKVTLRSFTRLSEERNAERTDLELLSVYREYGVIKKSSRDDNHNVESADLSNYKVVNKGSLVINKMKLWQGSLGVSKYAGIVSPAYIVCNLNCKDNLDFLNLLLRSALFKTYYNRISYGIRVGQWDSNYEDIKKLEIYLPLREEQDKIIQFLDHKLEKIHKFIANKQKLIALLEEQKQAIINQAVTKGLDLNAPMKHSGIDWLGEVPKHWEVTQVRKAYHVQLGKMLQPVQSKATDILLPYVCALNVFWDRIDTHNLKNMWFSPTEKEKYKLEKGDLIVVEGGDVATAQIWTSKVECYMQNAVHRVREKQGSLNAFLYYWLFMLKKRAYFEQICSKATLAHFTKEKFLSLILFRPPLGEQKQIVEYLSQQHKKIDTLITKYQKEIDLIQEYKTSLVSAVVTGQVDVKEITVSKFYQKN